MFLGVTASVRGYDDKEKEFSLIIDDNPLTDFVELPEQYRATLSYSNILCGVIRGALEMVKDAFNQFFQMIHSKTAFFILFQVFD